MDQSIDKLREIAEAAGAHFSVGSHNELSDTVDAVIDMNGYKLYILFTKIGGHYLATDLSSNRLPRELYSDTPQNSTTEEQRNNEIVSTVDALLNCKALYYPMPGFFHRAKGYIRIPIDQKETRIVQRKNYFGLPTS